MPGPTLHYPPEYPDAVIKRLRKDKTFCSGPQDKSKSGCRANYHYYYVKRPFKQLEKLAGRRAQ